MVKRLTYGGNDGNKEKMKLIGGEGWGEGRGGEVRE